MVFMVWLMYLMRILISAAVLDDRVSLVIIRRYILCNISFQKRLSAGLIERNPSCGGLIGLSCKANMLGPEEYRWSFPAN